MISYRLLQTTDAGEYRRLRLECLRLYPNYFGSEYATQQSLDQMFFEKQLERNIQSIFMMGAFYQEAELSQESCIGICGFVQGDQPRTAHRGAIIQMYVAKEFQGQGVARNLLEKTMDRAFQILGVDQIDLGVIVPNPAANKLYEKLGFKEYGYFENYFKVGDKHFDHRLMVKFKE